MENFLPSSLSSPKDNYGKSNCKLFQAPVLLDDLLLENPFSCHDYTLVIPTSLFWQMVSTQFIIWTLYQWKANVKIIKPKYKAILIFVIWICTLGLQWTFISLIQVGNLSLSGFRQHDTKAPTFITFLVVKIVYKYSKLIWDICRTKLGDYIIKIIYTPGGRLLEIENGWVLSKAKILKGKYEISGWGSELKLFFGDMNMFWKNTCKLLANSSVLHWPTGRCIRCECTTPSQTTNYTIFDTEKVGLRLLKATQTWTGLNNIIGISREMTSEKVQAPCPSKCLPLFFLSSFLIQCHLTTYTLFYLFHQYRWIKSYSRISFT